MQKSLEILARYGRRGLTTALLTLLASASPSLRAAAMPPGQGPSVAKIPPSIPLVLVGATVVDVTDWGRSAKDIPDAIVIVRDGRITDVGSRMAVTIPKGARVIDCTGKFIVPGLIDGYAGMNSQGQASAFLYMGVTTVVAASDEKRGFVDLAANPGPHVYLMDSIGTTDNWSLLSHHGGHAVRGQTEDWSVRLREGNRAGELSPEDTSRQLTDLARQGTRVLKLNRTLTAINAQWIIARAKQMGLVTYGEFVSTPYQVGIEAGVDALPMMGRYELGVIPEELQRPLVEDPVGPASTSAFDYSHNVPFTDAHLRNYARFISSHHAALMPAFTTWFLELPQHRNPWLEPGTSLLDAAHMSDPPDRATGELVYPLPYWTRHLPASGQRWMEEAQRKKAQQAAYKLWQINETLFSAYPHYLAASGAPVRGSMPGVGLHTELELLVRLGLSPREALAAATNNYALQFGWSELGMVTPGRRADLLVVDQDPTANIWNARRISLIVMDGNLVDRDALLNRKR